jgi:hypothetical protein
MGGYNFSKNGKTKGAPTCLLIVTNNLYNQAPEPRRQVHKI